MEKSCKKWLISWKTIMKKSMAKTGNSKLNIWMNFSEKSCKNWLVFMKNDQFGTNFSRKLSPFEVSTNFSEQKVAHFVKNGEKSAIWPKPTTFQANYHVSRFPWNFWTEVGKSGSFREKPWKIIDLAKTGNFSSTLSPFEIHELLKKISKSGSFRNLESSIWPKLATFRALTLGFMLRKKVAKSGSFPKSLEKTSIWPKLATFRANYDLSRFRWTFRKKVAKSGSFREKPSKITNLTKTGNFSSKLSPFEIWMNFSEKSCKKWLISWKTIKNHRFNQNWQLFVQKSGSFFVWTKTTLRKEKLQKVAHFVKNRQSIDLAKTGNFSSKPSGFEVSMNFSEKSCKKWLISWETMKNHRFG